MLINLMNRWPSNSPLTGTLFALPHNWMINFASSLSFCTEQDLVNLFAFNLLALEFVNIKKLDDAASSNESTSSLQTMVETIVNTLSVHYHPLKNHALASYTRIQLACLRTLQTLSIYLSFGNRYPIFKLSLNTDLFTKNRSRNDYAFLERGFFREDFRRYPNICYPYHILSC